ncbi:MAG: glycosyltransferase [Candidatus Gastranaerophilales bacterium]|nr:glycosyltransferase [Candidatus Gastranaerophilales bacterium]MCM1072669.1 glycosyltransferase [Bacteroides sp.]
MDKKKQNPKVSVILPIYNVEKFIPFALESLINQTLKDIEIICVDDCSTDNSLKVAQQYALKDNRIVVIQQDKNMGEVVAKHAGALIAQADYIGTLDPDDWVSLNFYEEMYKNITTAQADIAYCSYQITKENGALRNKFVNYPNITNLINTTINELNPGTTNKLIKKSIFLNGVNFTERDIWKDLYQYWRAYSNNNYKSVYVEDILYFYRQRKSSIMHTKEPIKTDYNKLLTTLDLIAQYLIKNKRYKLYASALWQKTEMLTKKKLNKNIFRKLYFKQFKKELISIAHKNQIPLEDLNCVLK